jgi:hypothetical protein
MGISNPKAEKEIRSNSAKAMKEEFYVPKMPKYKKVSQVTNGIIVSKTRNR